MSSSGKYNQYLNGKDSTPPSAFDMKVNDFMKFLNQIGLIVNKNDLFIVKRRFKMLAKDQNGKYEDHRYFLTCLHRFTVLIFEILTNLI